MQSTTVMVASLHLLLVMVLALPKTQASDSLQAIIDDFWRWRMQEFPEFATIAGEHAYDDKLENYTIAALETRYNKAREFSQRLDALDRSKLSDKEELNFIILRSDIKDNYLAGYEWMRYAAVNPVNNNADVVSNGITLILKPANSSRLEDYNNIIARLEAYPTQISQRIELMREAIRTSMTNHNVSMMRVAANINVIVSTPANASDLYGAFTSRLDNFTAITTSQKAELRTKAISAIHRIYEALRNTSAFVSQEYMPYARRVAGVSGFHRGSEFYQACLRWHTTTALTAQEVRDIGLREVERIRKQMEAVKDETGFNGTLREFQDSLRKDARFYYNSSEELLAGYKELVSKLDAKLPLIFGNETMPTVPCNVVPMKMRGAGGAYKAPVKPGDPGQFFVNVNYPEKRAKFSMMALTLHEANPGHHYQSIAQLNAPDLPGFRRYTDYSKYHIVPFQFPFQTAYAEGWGLYAEFLGEEIGAYETAYDRFGRYSLEIFRASRLVVDTGLHAFGWSREQAINYMMNTTFDIKEQVEDEVDRYITIPGQACAYKIGELKIKELRTRAQKSFGPTFDVKKFHTQVLQLGPVPLNVLEDYVNKWICTNTGQHCGSSRGATPAGNGGVLLLASLAAFLFARVVDQ